MGARLFYDRALTDAEDVVADALLSLEHGQTRAFGSVSVSRSLWGPWFYVQNSSGYRCESAGVEPTAVYVAGLMRIGGGQ